MSPSEPDTSEHTLRAGSQNGRRLANKHNDKSGGQASKKRPRTSTKGEDGRLPGGLVGTLATGTAAANASDLPEPIEPTVLTAAAVVAMELAAFVVASTAIVCVVTMAVIAVAAIMVIAASAAMVVEGSVARSTATLLSRHRCGSTATVIA